MKEEKDLYRDTPLRLVGMFGCDVADTLKLKNMDGDHVDGGFKKNKNVDSIFNLFTNLTGEKNQDPKFCVELIKSLRGRRFDVGSSSNLEYSLKRLLRGLGSVRLHTQCGCFAALSCILKHHSCKVEDVLQALEKERRPARDATKSELRALDISCVLAAGAIVQSGLFGSQPPENQQNIVNILIETGKKKSYLSATSFKFLADIVCSVEKTQFKETLWPVFKSKLFSTFEEFNADAFHFLLVCMLKHKVVNKFVVKKFSSPSAVLEKAVMFLLCNNVKYEHPVYENIGQLFCKHTETALEFWTNTIKQHAKTSSHKDAVFVTLFSHIIKYVSDPEIIPKLLAPKLIEILMTVLSFKKGKGHNNKDASSTARSALNSMVTLLCTEATTNETRFETIKQLLFYPANMKFEMKTGTKCIHAVTACLDQSFIKKLLDIYKKVIIGELNKEIDEDGTKEPWNSKEKQQALYNFTKTLNHPSLKKKVSWKLNQIKFIFEISFSKNYQLPSEVQKSARECFYKSVMLQMPSLKELVTILDELAAHLNENIENGNFEVNDDVAALWKKMYSAVQNLQTKGNDKLFIAVHVLLVYMGLYLFLDSEVAESGIEELLACYTHLKQVHEAKKDTENEDNPHWTEVTVDFILSLLSRENKLWRHVVSCVFPLIVAHLTPTALHQIATALDPKSENDVLKHVDSEDSDSNASETGSTSSEDDSDPNNDDDDEEDLKVNDQLRMAVRNALGYSAAACTDDESVDMDQMDEEEEKRLNESLSEAFRLFKTKSRGKQKKQTKEEEAMAFFRLRVLDLVEMYISHGPSLSGCLDLLLPLLDLLEFSVRNRHQGPLHQRVDSALKQIAAVKTFSDTTGVTSAIVEDVFRSVIGKKEIPALVFVEMAPRISDCATFLVRCSQLTNSEDGNVPLVNEYVNLIKNFFLSRDFKLPVSMFQSVLRIAWKGNFNLAATLFELLAATNIRIFKKIKITELLRIFYSNERLHADCDDASRSELLEAEAGFVRDFGNSLSEYEKMDSKSTEKMYLSFLSRLVALVKLIRTRFERHRRNTDESLPWKDLVLKIADLEIVINNKKIRSQLESLARSLNVQLKTPPPGKRKRTVSESSLRKENVEDTSTEPKKKKPKNKITAEKSKLKKESRRMREEMASDSLELVRFSKMDPRSLPEPESAEINQLDT